MSADSWAVENWPLNVFPNDAKRARRVLREHRTELLEAGAISRVGRKIVVLGQRYQRWLEKRSAHVPGYICAANRARDIASQT